MGRTENWIGIEILHERFKTIKKGKHSIHITAWPDNLQEIPFPCHVVNAPCYTPNVLK